MAQQPTGSIGRIPASELETAVTHAIRRQLQGDGTDSKPISETNRELIERHLLWVTVSVNEVMVYLRQNIVGDECAVGPDERFAAAETTVTIPLSVPAATTAKGKWTVSAAAPVKGIVHAPAYNTPMKPCRREMPLAAIAKARKSIKDIERGQSFAEIARREGQAERYIRHLAPLALVSPRIVTAIIDGTAPPRLTATALASRLPYSWAKQESVSGRKGLSASIIANLKIMLPELL